MAITESNILSIWCWMLPISYDYFRERLGQTSSLRHGKYPTCKETARTTS